jgi:hypothetical protein
MKISGIVRIGAALLLACTGCDQSEVSQNPSDYSPALIVARGATGIVYDKSRGADQVGYSLEAPYPADGVIRDLNDRLSVQGWHPLKADFMNPKLPTAHVTGWREQTDASVRPPHRVHSWTAEWKNDAGDILIYVLSYRYPEDGAPDLNHLDLVALYIPKTAADRALRQMEKF